MIALLQASKGAFRHRAAVIGAGFIAILVLATLIVPLLVGYDANQISDDLMVAPLSAGHPLGTDQLGRDVLVRLAVGIRLSLLVGVAAALTAAVVGILVGSLAGYYGGLLDSALMRVCEFFQIIPAFVMAALIVALAGPGLTRTIVVIALLAWPQAARIMRGQVLKLRGSLYVDSARCLGISERRLLWYEVAPNSGGPVLALIPLIVGQSILLQAALSYLGLGNPDEVSWGGMLADSQQTGFAAWWLAVLPGAAIVATVVAFNLVGDGLARIWNPREVVVL
ncbi:ABC transporter permease [Pseudonocardia sp. GCM10023141]|uniref:ABC transporter permease n=1 Tax=Pseudonocardia sp. GCM10023141 TaxID=3252653 RepID=UPI00360A6CE7